MQVKTIIPINVPTPQESCWDFIRLFESAGYLKKIIKEERGIDIKDTQATEIVWCIKHGRLFFESANSSDIYISPLLYYYSVLSFAHALTLLKNPTKHYLHSLSPSHGVSLRNKTAFNKISELETKLLSRGAFPELLESVDCQIIFEEKTKISYLPTAQISILANNTINFKEIIARIPELVYFYSTLFDEKPKCYPADWRAFTLTEEGKLKKIKYSLYVDPICGMDDTTFEEIIKTTEYQKSFEESPFTKRKYNAYLVKAVNSRFPNFYRALSGQNYIIKPFNFGNLNEISLYFILTYMLGMVVRYRPDIWSDTLSSNENTELPFIVNLIRIIKLKVPMLFLNHFSDKYYDIRYSAKEIGIGGLYL